MVSKERMTTQVHVAAEIFAITYWVPHADDELEDASPFQAFLPGILNTSELFDLVAGMPMDIRELFAERADVITARLAGFARTRIVPMRISAFESIVEHNETMFNVVLAEDVVAERAIQSTVASKRDWLHISTVRRAGAIHIDELSDSTFADYFRRVVRGRKDALELGLFNEFLGAPLRNWSAASVDCPRYMHNLTRPNERALSAFQFAQRGVEPMTPKSKNLYVAGSIRSARAVEAQRKKLTVKYGIPPHVNDLTLAVDSLTWGVAGADLRERLIAAGVSKQEASLILAGLNRSGYAAEVRFGGKSGDFGDLMFAVLGMRSAELRAFTSALILHSGLRLTPVLRLNPGLNRLRPSLIEIGNCARGNGPHRDFKLSKLSKRLADEMLQIVDRRTMAAVRGSAHRPSEVGIVADLPIEWLPVDGVPLCVKHDVSRVPCNPGNVMFAQCASNEISYVSRESFNEVLVVRSFRQGDPIARHLEDALSRRFGGEDAESAKVRFVDVSTPNEFRDAVNGFDGSIMIFDGHGTRDVETGVGSIVVGGKPLDIWGLRNELTLPPIVLLSACDTYPIDGSHGSSAVGMLALGARTVLGTMLPVHSIRACSLLARLIYRLAAFLPIAMRMYPNGVNWRLLMSGMLRMAYASEVIQSFAVAFQLELQQRIKIQLDANTNINSRNPKWHELLQKQLGLAASLPIGKVQAYCEKCAWITDSMRYVQLGRPELIHVVEKVPIDYMELQAMAVGIQ